MAVQQPEVIVIGGTPAGAAAATSLARQGRRVRLYDAGTFEPPAVTDWIPATLKEDLAALGLLDKLPAANPSGQAFGHAFPIRRGPFDKLLLDNARSRGAEVIVGVHVLDVLFEGDQAVGVSIIDTDCGSDEVPAKVIIDATGPKPIVAKKQAILEPAPPKEFVGWGYIDGAALTRNVLPSMFFGIGLPEDQVCLGAVLPMGFPHSDWPKQIPASVLVPKRQTRPITFEEGMRVNERLTRRAGHGWLALFGAFGAYDPLILPGVGRGLVTGIKAAHVVDAALKRGDVSAAALAPFEQEAGNVSLLDALKRGCA